MRSLRLLPAALLLAAGCSCGDDPPGGGDDPPSTAKVHLRVVREGGSPAIAGARAVVIDADTGGAAAPAAITDGQGRATVEVDPGAVYVRAFAQGHHPRPLPGAPAVPIEAALGDNAEVVIELLPLAPGEGGDGRIAGRVGSAQGGVGGALVVAATGSPTGDAPSAISDEEGRFEIFNVHAGTYTVSASHAGMAGTAATVDVPAGGAATGVELELARGGTGTVQGKITFLAVQNGAVRVTLLEQHSHEAVPGLAAGTDDARNYRIEGVPPGSYVAWAALENEAPVPYVMDPDAIRKAGGPPVVAIAGGATVTQDFDVTGAVRLVGPTNEGTSLAPVLVEGTPVFEWTAYSSADAYILEVADELGTVAWGGFEGSTPIVQLPRSVTRVAYGAQGEAAPLVPGRTYRWRVFARKDNNREPAGYNLISMSEDQRGLFRVAR